MPTPQAPDVNNDRQSLLARFSPHFGLLAAAWTACIAASLVWGAQCRSAGATEPARGAALAGTAAPGTGRAEPRANPGAPPLLPLVVTHGGLWLVGLLSIALFRQDLRRQIRGREQAEHALRESRECLRAFIDHVPVPVQGYGTDGIVTYWNRASEQVYGYRAEEAHGRHLGDLILPPPVRPHFRAALEAGCGLSESGEFLPAGEIELVRKDGSPVTVHSTHTAVCRPGQLPLLFCLDLDLSDRLRTERELRKLNHELSQFNSFAVGRELRMIELKQEVNALCAAAGQPERYAVQPGRQAPGETLDGEPSTP